MVPKWGLKFWPLVTSYSSFPAWVHLFIHQICDEHLTMCQAVIIDVDTMTTPSLPSRICWLTMENDKKTGQWNTLRWVLGQEGTEQVVKEGFLDLVGFSQVKQCVYGIRDKRDQGALRECRDPGKWSLMSQRKEGPGLEEHCISC